MSKRKWMEDAAVVEHRTEFASGEVSVEGLARRTGLSTGNIRRMLTGDTYEKVGGPLADPEFARQPGETFAAIRCAMSPEDFEALPEVTENMVVEARTCDPLAAPKIDPCKSDTPRIELDQAAIRNRLDSAESEAERIRRLVDGHRSSNFIMLEQESSYRRTGETIAREYVNGLVKDLRDYNRRAKWQRAALGWAILLLTCGMVALGLWIGNGGVA